MAFVLSLSILEFGSFLSPWFQDHWRSRDIYFFLENRDIDPVSNGPTQYPSSLSFAPHISALFDTGVVAIPRRSLARNNQLFSLAVVLTEIAFGKPLADIESPSGIPTFGQEDIISEYVKLKDIIDTRLAGEIGQKYATVVERLFYCEFGLDLVRDFTKKEMQVQYYGMVVGKLEECVKVLEQLDED